MLAHTLSRHLPGIRFETRAPQLTESLQRMDIAVFVGFASSGPLHIPVVIEDIVQFSMIFGDNAPLAWDKESGKQVYANLAPAVRGFFSNGGRRCWVIRVADERTAKYNYFPIPGLAMAQFDNGNLKQIRPAFAKARSEGSWSDPLSVSAILSTQPLEIKQFSFNKDLSVDCWISQTTKILTGDILRLYFAKEGYIAMFYVGSVKDFSSSDQLTSPPGPDLLHIKIFPERVVWFNISSADSLPLVPKEVHFFTHEKEISLPVASKPLEHENTNITVYINLPLKDAPPLGTVMRVDCETEQLWLTVQKITTDKVDGSPPDEIIKVKGEGLWWLKEQPDTKPESIPNVEKLTFDLLARRQNEYPVRMQNMAFSRLNTRFLGFLPTDKELYKKCIITPTTDHTDIWREASNPRFPLAAEKQQDVVEKFDPCLSANREKPQDTYYFPIGMQIMPEHFLKAEEQIEEPIVRDGLSKFSTELFLDRDMMHIGTERLMSEADFLRYQSPKPRSLKGIHAAIDIEEATIIAVPDAIHRGWDLKESEFKPVVIESSPPFRPEWWRYLDCNISHEEQKKRLNDPKFRVDKPFWKNFLNCGIQVIPAPELQVKNVPDQTGTFTLEWKFIPDVPNEKFILEESSFSDFSGAVEIYNGTQKSLTVYGRGYGSYYYRVCAVVNSNSSDWSNGASVRIGPEKGLILKEVKEYSDSTLLAVQRSLLRLSAARGDLFAVITLPEHYCDADAAAHIKKFKAMSGKTSDMTNIPPLNFGETRALSYGALYHPWLIVHTEEKLSDLQHIPPDGAACGLLAKSAIMRGAWIAPANELFSGVIALTPVMPQERWLNLQEAQINLIRQEPHGFVSMSADTLSDDEDLRPINVRRLLILLRRLALRLGATYVFESIDEPFRRMVQRGFEAMLEQMLVRGAFAGNTPATSYQVIADSSLNTPQSVDQGRFIVELRVAPSLPMTFITVRLIQTGGKISVTEGR